MNIARYITAVPSETEDLERYDSDNKVYDYYFYLDGKESIPVAIEFFEALKMDVDICYKKVISTVTDIEKTKPYLKLIFERYANYERCECYQNLSIGGVIWFRIEDNISRQFVLNYEVYYPIDGKYAESDKNDLDRRGVDIDKLATLNKEFLC